MVPPPIHLFVTGGARTGKSYLIKAIQHKAKPLLAPVALHLDDITVLIMAPTGTVAYNLRAPTIHTAFSISKDIRLPYTLLGEDKLNTLCVKYASLKILIIDEISMVMDLLAYIHGCLHHLVTPPSLEASLSLWWVTSFSCIMRGKPLYVQNMGADL